MVRRYFVDALPNPGVHRLPKDAGHHLGRVLRARAGDQLVLCDGRGGECPARLLAVSGDRVDAEVGEARQTRRAPSVELELAFALPKGTRAEWLFEHATEIGAAVLRPLATARSEVRSSQRHARWERITRSAAAQCGRTHLPTVHELETLDELLARGDLPSERYVAQAGGEGLGVAKSGRALLLVGPPGDLTVEEVAKCEGCGFEVRGLGPLVLRTETAVLAGGVLLLGGR